MECVVIRLQLKRWENRGFAKLPFCVIYGFSVLIAMVLFMPIKRYIIAVYIAGCVGATIFEYLIAMAMIKLFGEVGGITTIFVLITREYFVCKVH